MPSTAPVSVTTKSTNPSKAVTKKAPKSEQEVLQEERSKAFQDIQNPQKRKASSIFGMFMMVLGLAAIAAAVIFFTGGLAAPAVPLLGELFLPIALAAFGGGMFLSGGVTTYNQVSGMANSAAVATGAAVEVAQHSQQAQGKIVEDASKQLQAAAKAIGELKGELGKKDEEIKILRSLPKQAIPAQVIPAQPPSPPVAPSIPAGFGVAESKTLLTQAGAAPSPNPIATAASAVVPVQAATHTA